MSWEARAGCRNRYYSRSRRVGGRVVREYIGAGPAAEVAAAMDAAERTGRAARRAALSEERAAIAAARAASSVLACDARSLVHATMAAAGFHLHGRSTWRRRRMPKDMNDLDTDDPLLPPGAGPGPDGPTLAEVLAFLHGTPPPPPRAAATGFISPAEGAWADLLAGPDPVAREAVDAKLGEFRAALGPAASPLEQLLAEEAGVAWLASTYFSTRTAECLADDSTDAHRDFLARNADRAARKLAFLVKQLLTVRRLLRPDPVPASPRPAVKGDVKTDAKKPPRGGRKRPHNSAPASRPSGGAGAANNSGGSS